MRQIQIQHYRVEGLNCPPCVDTLKTLNDLCRQMAPRFAALRHGCAEPLTDSDR